MVSSGISDVAFSSASGADRHLDITVGLQVVESSCLVSVLSREAFSHPYTPFFHLLVKGFCVTNIYTDTNPITLPCSLACEGNDLAICEYITQTDFCRACSQTFYGVKNL